MSSWGPPFHLLEGNRMKPTTILETAMTTTLANSTTAHLSIANKLLPVINPFTESDDMSAMVAGDIASTAAFLGITMAAATRQSARNPNTGAYMVNIPPPAGGYEELSGSGGTYPITVYGVVHVKTPYTIPDDIIGSRRFAEAQVITAANQLLLYGDVNYSFDVGAWY